MAGQSNMYGLTDFTDFPAALSGIPRDSVEYWVDGTREWALNEATSWGPETTAIHDIALQRGGPIVFVKRSYPATSLYTAWRPGGYDALRGAVTGEGAETYQYDLLVADIAAALNGRVAGRVVLCWLQGEKDSRWEATANDYADGLDNLLTVLQADTGLAIGLAVIGRVRPFPAGTYQYKGTVRAAQDAAPVESPGGCTCVTVDLDAITPTDALHYDAAGYQTTGLLFSAEAK